MKRTALALTSILALFASTMVGVTAAVQFPAPVPPNTRNLTDPSYMIVNRGANDVLGEPWRLQGIRGTMYPSDPTVPHNGGSNEFFFEYVRIYQGSYSIMVGWSECGWQPDRALVTEYDTISNSWTFYPQYTIVNNSTEQQSYNFEILYEGNGVWQSFILSNDGYTWQLLSSVQLGIIPSNQTYAEFGMSEYSPTQNWFVIPQTGVVALTIPSSPGIGGGGIHSFYYSYSNRNPPPLYSVGPGDYANMIHLSTVSPTPSPIPSPNPSPTPTPQPPSVNFTISAFITDPSITVRGPIVPVQLKLYDQSNLIWRADGFCTIDYVRVIGLTSTKPLILEGNALVFIDPNPNAQTFSGNTTIEFPFQNSELDLTNSTATPTPKPTATPTPTPTPTPIPTPSPSPSPTPTPTPTASPTPFPTATPTSTPTLTPTPSPTPSPTPTPTATPTPTPSLTATPKPTSSPPVITSTPSPTPSATTVPATADNGATIDLTINGNVTSSQMSNVTITSSQSAFAIAKSASTTTLSFTLSGQSGTTGFSNVTIPKSVILYGTTPTIYIDNQPAQNQGYTQDTNNYYVWYTIHFSTHKISIVFATTPILEFPIWIIPPLFFATIILLSIVFIRKGMPKKAPLL